MAETDTAVAEPETTQAEPTPVEQDTEAVAVVDTEGEADEADTETFTLDQVEEQKQAAIKEALAQAKAEQDEAAQARNYQAILQRSAQVLNSTAVSALDGVLNHVFERFDAGDSVEQIRRTLARNAINGIGFSLGEAAFVQQMDAISESQRAYVAKVAPDFKPSAELVRELELAQRTLPGDQPHSQAQRRVDAEWAFFFQAAKEAALKEVRAEEAELNKKAEGTKALAKAGTNGQKPVSGGGGATAPRLNFKTQYEADVAFEKGQISSSEMRQIMDKGLPYR